METARKYLRFPLAYRVEHWVLVLSFTVLALTGLVQKYAQSGISIWIIGLLGGIEAVRIIHRIAATVLMIEIVYHVGSLCYQLWVKRSRADMMLSRRDFRVGWQLIKYNLGLRKERPKQGRYTFEEKVEYFSLAWGTLLMVVTGFMLWNPIATTNLLPGEFIPAAKAAHGNEALLALLAIIVWHFYHVHVRSFNKSMFTGYLSEEEMEEEHPLELERIKAELDDQPDSEGIRQRRRIFVPVYSVVAALMLIGIYVFVTFEETAIETVTPPDRQLAAFSPWAPPATPTPPSLVAELESWEEGVGTLFQSKCGFCHGGSNPLARLDLTDYDKALLSGSTLPAILPGDADGSGVVVRQQQGDHPVLFTTQELNGIITWINDGAPTGITQPEAAEEPDADDD
jgi:formate dehydrogenase gamma subunit